MGVLGVAWRTFRSKAFTTRTPGQTMEGARREDGGDMKKVLGAFDLMMLGVGAIIGAGVFVLTGVAARCKAGPSVVLSYLLSSIAAMLAALSYAEFAVEVPVAGGAYVYVSMVFGEFLAWQVAISLVLEYTLGAAAVAKGFSGYISSFIGLASDALVWPKLSEGDDCGSEGGSRLIRLDFLAALLVIFLCLMLAFSTKESSKFNIVVTAINLATILIVLLAAFPHVDSSNYEPFAPKGLTGLFNAAAVVFFSYIGFDTVATTAEEVKNPKLDLPIGIVGSLGVCSVLYSLMCLAITGLEKYSKIDINAPFSEAFRDIGIGWVGRIVSVGAVAGIVTSLLVNLMGQARIYMVLGREELIPSWIARIDPQRSTPLRATMVTMCTAGSLALFLDIEILSSLVSMGTLFALGLVSLAVIVRRYHRSGDAETFWPVAVRVGVLLFGAFFQGLAFELKWHPVANAIFLVVWLVGTLSLTRLSVAYEPLSFSVPLKPLTPSLGVLFTLHLMFSLGRGAYLLFGSLQVVGAVGYVLYGMHRSQGDGPVGEVRMSKLPSSEDWRGARSERDDRKLMAGFAGTSDEAVMPGEWDVHVGRPKPGVRL